MLPIRSAEGSGAKDDIAEDAEYDDTLQFFTPSNLQKEDIADDAEFQVTVDKLKLAEKHYHERKRLFTPDDPRMVPKELAIHAGKLNLWESSNRNTPRSQPTNIRHFNPRS